MADRYAAVATHSGAGLGEKVFSVQSSGVRPSELT
jgi:hypothetical protein